MATKPWGVTNDYGFPPNIANITALQTSVGYAPNIVAWPHDFLNDGTYTASEFQSVLTYGAIPLLTFTPKDHSAVTTIANADVLAGTYDTIINAYANGIKALSGTVYLRLAHEMNGNSYPWCPGQNGNTAASYVSMWQYVYNKFAAAGCTNVKWVWCPDHEHTGTSATYAQVYPGDSYVDILGVDGYNFGENDIHGWVSYSTVFNQSLTDLVTTAPTKPIGICEIGCLEAAYPLVNSKAAWIEDMAYKTLQDSRVTFWIWFDHNATQGDCSIATSVNSRLAFTSALGSTKGFSVGIHV